MTPRQKIDALTAMLSPEIRDAFLLAIADIVDNALLGQIVTAIETGNFDLVYASLGLSRAVFRPIEIAMERALTTVGQTVGQSFPHYLNTPNGKTVFRFDARSPRAEEWLRTKSSTLVAEIEDDIRSSVRNTLDRGIAAGRNPRSTALDIIGRVDPATGRRAGGVIGLTANQEHWVNSARVRLETLDSGYFDLELRDKRFDSVVRRAIESGQPLQREQIDRFIDRYRAAALRYRAENIARTETIHALNRGDYEATMQAFDMGAFRESAVKRTWDDAHDDRVRSLHVGMRGQVVGLREPFVSPLGSRLMHPGDSSLGAQAKEVIACRCRVKTEIDWLDGVQ